MMEDNSPDSQTEEGSALDKFFDTLEAGYQEFNVFSAIGEDDGIWLVIGKILLRIVGFIILLALSPFLLLGLFIAILAVL